MVKCIIIGKHKKVFNGINNKKVSSEMKTYKEFVQESSLSRIKSKADKGGIATLTSDRGGLSRKENQKRSQQLQKDIRGKFGRGPTKLKGSYDEKDEKTGESRKVKEKSFAIDRGKMGKIHFAGNFDGKVRRFDRPRSKFA